MKLNRNYKRINIIFFAIILLLINFTSVIAQASISCQEAKESRFVNSELTHQYNLESLSIAIVFDEYEELISATGKSLAGSLRLMTTVVDEIGVTSFDQIREKCINNQYSIIIYVFQSSYDGLIINNEKISWDKIARFVEIVSKSQHIFATGNTKQLLEHVTSNNVHCGGEEILDAHHAFVYSLWTIADVLEQYYSEDPSIMNFVRDTRISTLHYFTENFNDLMTRSIQPQDILGEEDPLTVQSRVDKFYEENPASYEKQPREIDGTEYVVDQETLRLVNPETQQVLTDGYVVDLFKKENSLASDFILQALPSNSGLRGPIGGIVDELLSYLFDEIGGEIGLDSTTVNQIVGVLQSIPDLVGAIQDPSASKMKQFLDQLKPMLPIPHDMMKYFDMVIDALFLIRGDSDDILSFIQSAIEMVAPDFTIGGFKLSDILKELFTLGPSVIDKISSGGNVVDIIFSILNENIVQNLTSTFIGNLSSYIPSITNDNIISISTKLINTTRTVINFITNFNVKDLLLNYAPQLLSTAFNDLFTGSLSPQTVNITMKAVTLLMVATKLVDDITLEEAFISLMKDVVPEADVEEIATTTKGIIANITKAINSEMPSITDFKNQLLSTLNLHDIGLSTDMKAAIQEVSTLIVAISNKNFNIASGQGLTNITTVVNKVLTAFGHSDPELFKTINKVITTITGLVSYVTDTPSLKAVIGSAMDALPSPEKLLQDIIVFVIEKVSGSEIGESLQTVIDSISQGISIVMSVVGAVKGNGVQGLLVSLLQGASFVVSKVAGIDVQAYSKIAEALFGKFLGWSKDTPTITEIMESIMEFIPQAYQNEIKLGIDFLLSIKDIFTDGFRTIFSKLTEWLSGKVTELLSGLSGSIGGILSNKAFNLLNLEIPIGLGTFSLFKLNISLGISLGLDFNVEAFSNMLYDLVFKGVKLFESSDPFNILRECLSFFSITPLLKATLEMKDFGTGENSLMSWLLAEYGVEMAFSGYGFFTLQLFSFKNGIFSWDDFLKIVEWGFGFKVSISKAMTVLDLLTGGAGSSLTKIAKYIGLDLLTLTITFAIGVDIVKRAATAIAPETGSLTLTVALSVAVSFGVTVMVSAIPVKMSFKGTLTATLTFLQDLVKSTPLEAWLGIALTIKCKIKVAYLINWKFNYDWSPSGSPWELTSSKASAKQDGAMGVDSDEDGLSDEYEENMPGLNPYAFDSDLDTLTDKFETQTYGTDPANPDSDNDGLIDGVEYQKKTNPMKKDSDGDGLDDYEEIMVLGTNPLTLDTDFDGLDDYYEVNFAYNVTGITPSVTSVIIGGITYYDRTNPLQGDTDGDGLLDGEEGSRGIYYGPELYNDTLPSGDASDPLLIFNGGYTHPLDNDTDDDSYEQLYDGSISPRKRWLRDMSDYTEINGIWIIYIDTETGEPLPAELVRTNPVLPDSDGDTGVTAAQRENPPFAEFLNSDGYELALNPPTDPNDGDSDDDGLIDGYEGILKSDSNHTHALNPDTDGDGLGDLQEVQLGTDPRIIDTDYDNIADGQEYFTFGTNPFLADTDSDGLEDGEEIWLYHSSPFLRDSDIDGISDYDEVYIYYSNPMDEDSDNDFLNDYEEIFIYYTDPYVDDTDGDGLLDGEEILGLILPDNLSDLELFFANPLAYTGATTTYFTDPTKFDSDNDSLTTINQYEEISMSMGDGEEYMTYHTNPTLRDSDRDGIEDGWELWLGKGEIPNFEPLLLNSMSNDTDGDGLLDGQELVIANITTLLYPYIGFYPNYPFNTSPVSYDTDEDNLNDKFEIEHTLNPQSPDSDNDSLNDFDEVYLYFTDGADDDTDGDGLLDWEEIGPNRVYMTNPNSSDSDSDLLPDGYEVLFYGRDPLNPDENNNSILDGMEIDTDGDRLMDGEEFFIYKTAYLVGGGIEQPDSDYDGLFDGQEVYDVGTNCTLWDTDNDTYSDGLEFYLGTDPLNFTSIPEMTLAIENYGLEGFLIVSPTDIEYTTTTIPVIVWDPSGEYSAFSVKYREIDSLIWSTNTSLIYNNASDQWQTTLSLPYTNATYELQVTGSKGSTTIVRSTEFNVLLAPDLFDIISPIEGLTYYNTSLPVQVKAGIHFTNVNFSLQLSNGTWTDNISISYDSGLQAYYLADYQLPHEYGNNSFTMKFYGTKTTNQVIVEDVSFFLYIPKPQGIDPVLVLVGGGTVAAVGGGALLVNKFGVKGLVEIIKKKFTGGN